MKTTKRILCVLLSLLLTVGGLAAPAYAAQDDDGPAPSKTPEETFTPDLFSNAALNSLLALFPQICADLEETLSNNKADWEADVKQGLSGEDPFSCNGSVSVYYNGEGGTAAASEFLAAAGAYIYPETLGAFLQDQARSDIAGALSAAGDDWSVFEENGGYAFDFDWGIDGIADLSTRYEAFAAAAGALIDAAPMLKAALGSDDITVPFAADAGFCRITARNVSLKYMMFTLDLNELSLDNMAGTVVFSAGDAFARQIVPLYRCLGLGEVLPFDFSSVTADMNGKETAEAVYGPLYALIGAAQNGFADAPGAAAFYAYTAAQLFSELPDNGGTALSTRISVDTFDAAVYGGASPYQLINEQTFNETVRQSVLEYLQLGAAAPASLEIPFGKTALGSLLFGLSVVCPEGFHEYVPEGVPDGDTHAFRCVLCGNTYAEPHTVVVKDFVAPTCTAEGHSGREECAVCGYILSYGEITPPTGHLRTETVEAEPPTATAPGRAAGVRCTDCGAWLSGGEAIPPEAEDWGYCGAEGDGTGLVWTLNAYGRLTISGEGKIADYTLAASGDANGSGEPLSRYSTAPWCGSAENAGRIKSVVIGDGVTNLGEFAFYGCTALKTVEFPENIMHLGYRTFADCTALTEVTLPMGISELGDALFGGCTALREITIPENVRFVGKDAFLRCTALKYVFYTGSEDQWNNIGGEAGSEPLYEARIFYNTVDHGHCGSERDGDGTNLVWALDGEGTLTIAGEGATDDYTIGLSSKLPPWYGYRNRIVNVIVEEGVTAVGSFAFTPILEQNNVLTSVSLPESLLSIGDVAFNCCSALSDISIPSGVTSIGTGAFNGCTSLTAITIPASVTELGAGAFCNCTALTQLTVDANNPVFKTDARGCLYDYVNHILIWYPVSSNDGDYTVTDGTKTIEKNAFLNCGNLSSVKIPASVTSIRQYAFSGCSGLTDVYYGGSETQWSAIDIGADNDALRNANIHFNAGKWGYCGAEGDGANLTWFLDSEGVLTVSGTGAMADYTATTKMAGVTMRLVSDAPWFDYKEDIKAVVVEDGVTGVGTFAFGGMRLFSTQGAFSNLRSVALPDSVTAIGGNAFEGCVTLTDVTLGEGLTAVGDSAFSNCTALKYVFYPGSEAQWNAVSAGDDNEALQNARIYYNVIDHGCCGAEGDGTNLIWVFDKTNLLTFSGEGAIADTEPQPISGPNGITAMGLAIAPWNVYLYGPEASFTILLEEGVTRIGKNAFLMRASVKELIVLNRSCDLTYLVIKEPTFLRGYLDSTAKTYANNHSDDCVFMPLCNVDYRHEMIVDFGDASTCVYRGHEEGVYCTVCGEYRYGHWEKDLGPHTWGPWTVTKPATAQEDGLQTRECTVCGATEEAVITATDDGKIIVTRWDYDDNPIARAMRALIAWFQKLLNFFRN